MTKIQKTGLDGKLYYYWHFSEDELLKMREKREEQKKARTKHRKPIKESI